MVQKVTYLLICDVCNDGTAGTENIRFGLDGVNYELDACDPHAAQLRGAFAPYSGAGRRATAGGSASAARSGRRRGGSDRVRTQAIRAWAKRKGIKVSERGRIAADLAAQYDAANR